MFTRICVLRVILACLCLETACSTLRKEEGIFDSSKFARQTAVPYFTSSPYERWPGTAYPDNPTGYFLDRESAIKLVAVGNCEAAIPVLERLVKQYQDDSELWVDLGLCQSALDQNVAAIESLRNAIELGSTIFNGRFEAMPTEIMVRIGWLYAKTGDTEQALTWIKRALTARNANRPSLANQPEAALMKGNRDFAELAGLQPDQTLSRDEKWRYDITFLADQVAMLHFDPDQHTPAQVLEHALQDLYDSVPNLSDEEIVIRIQRFMGMLGAGHDVLFAGSPRYGAAKTFAFRLYLFTDGLYVIEADDKSLVGARIEAFVSTPADIALQKIGQVLPRDNNQTARWNGPFVLTFPVMLQAMNIIKDAKEATLTITDRNGKRRIIKPELSAPRPNTPALVAPPAVAAPLYLSRMNETYWTKTLPEIDSIYVQVNGMNNSQEGESFTEFCKRLMDQISTTQVDNMILDLRHNIGGNSYLADQLLKVLVYFDMKPEEGDIYVLIGRNTYSSAQMFITRLESLSDAIFVGEPSGSRPNFIGRVGQFVLPYSGLMGFLSSELSQESLAEDHRIWIAPDMPVALSSTEFFTGQDPALDAIRKLIVTRQ